MIAYVKGTLTEKKTDRIVVEAQGVGYEVFVTPSTIGRLPALGGEVTVQTAHIVREDAQQLYGFLTRGEKESFELLQTVQGVGPKSALNVLSGLAPEALGKAVSQGNVALLKSVPGVGNKTAQRIIVELKDKIGLLGPTGGPEEPGMQEGDDKAQDAYTGLIHLGYRQPEAREAIRKALKKLSPPYKAEDLVREALREMSR